MQNLSDQKDCVYMLAGMGLCSSRYPSLAAFKRWLLTGDAALGEQLPAAVDSSPTARLRLALASALRDAVAVPQQAADLPLVLHASSQVLSLLPGAPDIPAVLAAAFHTEPDARASVHTVTADFTEAFHKALEIMQTSEEAQVALCAWFIEADSQPGAACLLLTRQNPSLPAYAILDANGFMRPAAPSVHGLETSAAQTGLADPVLVCMAAALGLNSRMHFPLLDDPRLKQTSSVVNRSVRPWFSSPFDTQRETRINLDSGKDPSANILLEKSVAAPSHPVSPFADFGLFLLPLVLEDVEDTVARIGSAITELQTCADLPAHIDAALARFAQHPGGAHTLAVLGSSRQELIAELERARNGLPDASAAGKDWQTPAGSYFTPAPLGAQAKVAFVYPGAFGTYVGMGREIFHLFPQLHDALQLISEDPGGTLNQQIIFPPPGTAQTVEQLQEELNDNPTAMISSGVCFSYLFTIILRDIFKIQPQAAFGYSLGENSMMFAMDVWSQAGAMRTSLEASPIFHERVSGPQNAIREFWNLSRAAAGKKHASLWANYVLMAPVEKVRAALQAETRVYLTHINTPRQVVIGGEKAACQRVAQALGCMHLQAPYHHAIHCDAVVSEFDAFERLHDWPVENETEIPIYSAAYYAPLQHDSKAIAESFARMLTHTIDFPRLVELAYAEGSRVFIELGAGSNCSKWIEAILKGRPFAAMTINQSGLGDHSAILRLLARLISHGFKPDLTALKGH